MNCVTFTFQFVIFNIGRFLNLIVKIGISLSNSYCMMKYVVKSIAQAYPNSKNDRMKFPKFTPELITAYVTMRKFALDRAEQSDLHDVSYSHGKQVHILGRDAVMHRVANRVTLCVIHFNISIVPINDPGRE